LILQGARPTRKAKTCNTGEISGLEAYAAADTTWALGLAGSAALATNLQPWPSNNDQLVGSSPPNAAPLAFFAASLPEVNPNTPAASRQKATSQNPQIRKPFPTSLMRVIMLACQGHAGVIQW